MTISTEKKIWTDEEFMALPKDGRRYDTRLVWVIHPDEKYVLVYHSPEPDGFLRSTDSLDGETVAPGFSMALSELFEEWDFLRHR